MMPLLFLTMDAICDAADDVAAAALLEEFEKKKITIKMRGIIIVDLGSQYTQLIAKKVRESFVYCEVVHYCQEKVVEFGEHSELRADASNVSGIIVSGSPSFVDADSVQWFQRLLTMYPDVPVLGLCFGHQLLGAYFTKREFNLGTSGTSEFGKAKLTLCTAARFPKNPRVQGHPMLNELDEVELQVWTSHQASTPEFPKDWTILGTTESDPNSFVSDPTNRYIGMQFHPEVDHTERGSKLLYNFAVKICKSPNNWKPVDQCVLIKNEIRASVGQGSVILALSGGVDSAVAASLLTSALGPGHVWCVFVDTGLLKAGETERVKRMFAHDLGGHLIIVDAHDIFMKSLVGVTDPETKRKIIGKLFVDIIEGEAKRLKGITHFAQGTIYSDVIESSKNHCQKDGTLAKAHTIKSHHNVGGLPEHLKYELLEPLRHLFKNEVRQLGLSLGLPREAIYRHPFPGPGLAIRIIGEITQPKVDVVRKADSILMGVLHKHDLYNKISQAYAGLLGCKATGVKGDCRSYGRIVIIRCVRTGDFMTATFSQIDHLVLEELSTRITNEIPSVVKVVYDITNKPPSTIELE